MENGKWEMDDVGWKIVKGRPVRHSLSEAGWEMIKTHPITW
jgi:hypothetical protein